MLTSGTVFFFDVLNRRVHLDLAFKIDGRRIERRYPVARQAIVGRDPADVGHPALQRVYPFGPAMKR